MFLSRSALPSLLALAAASVRTADAVVRPFRAIDVLNGDVASEEGGREEETDKDVHLGVPDDLSFAFVEQPLDHFPSSDRGGDAAVGAGPTFRQRYFYSSRYVRGAPSPGSSSGMGVRGGGGDGGAGAEAPSRRTYAFLCVGGEGPSLTDRVFVDSVHCTGDMIESARRLREEKGADVHMFALEHRYYGQSYPDFSTGGDDGDDGSSLSSSPVTNEHLRYHSSRQALSDLYRFVEFANEHDRFGLKGTDAKWIAFGGSYPGMLAAWSRSKRPDLVHAAISNSAPVRVRLDFPEYKERVGLDLRYEKVGGSEECLAIVTGGHDELVQSLRDDGGRRRVGSLFGLCGGGDELEDEKNARLFLGDGAIDVPAQGNDPSCDGELCNVADLCSTLIKENNKSSSPMEALAAVHKMQHRNSCTTVDWNGTLRYLSSPAALGDRSWLWQTCTEFGFYQTCEVDSSCPFAKGYHPLSVDFEICEKAFGVSKSSVERNVKSTVDHYGGQNLEATRILSVNGDVDPWSALAIVDEATGGGGGELPTHEVPGASHHFWTHEVKESDGKAVVDAREVIYRQILVWLGEDEEGPHGLDVAPTVETAKE